MCQKKNAPIGEIGANVRVMKESFACGQDSSHTLVLPSMEFPKVTRRAAMQTIS